MAAVNKKNKLSKYYKYGIPLLLFVIVLIIIAYYLINSKSIPVQLANDTVNTKVDSVNSNDIKNVTSNSIDSVMDLFGIKKSWILTKYPNDKQNIKDKKTADALKSIWFGKLIAIPDDVNAVEINFELTQLAREMGFEIKVDEDYKKKDLNISYYNSKDTSQLVPLIRLLVRHDSRVKRDNNYYSIILSGIQDYKDEDIEDLLKNEFYFSYLIPYDLEYFDLISKLNHEKKDVILELNVGDKDNFDTDFHLDQNEKEISAKVKNILFDYRIIKNVFLTKQDNLHIDAHFQNILSSEFGKNNIWVLFDSLVVNMKNIGVEGIMQKLFQQQNAIIVVDLEHNELLQLRESMNLLKKKGHKFFTLSDYMVHHKNTTSRLEKIKNAEIEKRRIEQNKIEQQRKTFKNNQKNTKTNKSTKTKK